MSSSGSVTRFRIRHRIRKLPAGNLIVRVGIFVLGLAFILLGLVLVVLPGPLTIPPVLLGLLIWSLEFEWAERWVGKARVQASAAWEAAKAHPWRVGLMTGGGVVLAVVALLLVSHYDLVARAKDVIS